MATPARVMISLRFSEALNEAKIVKKQLEAQVSYIIIINPF